MIKLIDKATGRELGEVTPEQFQALVDVLEEESADDTDYYINSATLDLLREGGADPALIAALEQGLAGREDMDVQWRRV
jgi:recombinational DNA repair protein (RecF pathway)